MTRVNRRNVLLGSTFIAGAFGIPGAARADVVAGRDAFDNEVTRTDGEWRALLGERYPIMRQGKTEVPMSSDIWAEAREGRYDCRGCDLTQYRSNTKVNLPKGWLFFKAGAPNAQLMSQDSSDDAEFDVADLTIEVHCRRCGSHMGHILLVEGQVLHCVNGASLRFLPAA